MGDWEICIGQTQGARQTQDDAHSCAEWLDTPSGRPGVVLSIADGMGAYEGGAMAASAAVEASTRTFLQQRGSLRARLQAACDAANAAVADIKAKAGQRYASSGCTLVIACLDDAKVSWASVGDSVLWMIRGEKLTRLNRDHSMMPVLEQMVLDGEISAAEAMADPNRNVLRSALTGSLVRLTDFGDPPLALKRRDAIIAATDGVLPIEPGLLAQLFRRDAELPHAIDTALALLEKHEDAARDNATIAVCRRARRWFDFV